MTCQSDVKKTNTTRKPHQVDPTISKNMKVFKNHTRVSSDYLGIKRNFNHGTYGDQHIAIKAASLFEWYGRGVISEFESYGRHPVDRKALLTLHGIPDAVLKKSIKIQREVLSEALSNGTSKAAEKAFHDQLWGALLSKDLASRSVLHVSVATFKAEFSGSQQKLEQEFKTFKAAADWVVYMDNADKDRGVWCWFSSTVQYTELFFIYMNICIIHNHICIYLFMLYAYNIFTHFMIYIYILHVL